MRTLDGIFAHKKVWVIEWRDTDGFLVQRTLHEGSDPWTDFLADPAHYIALAGLSAATVAFRQVGGAGEEGALVHQGPPPLA